MNGVRPEYTGYLFLDCSLIVSLFDNEFDLNLFYTQSLGPFDFAQMPAIVASVVPSD